MDRDRLVNLLARGALLFGLCVVLVFGFWEHRNFYQFGFYNVLLVGGLATLLVFMGFRLVLRGELPRLGAHGEMTFTLQEGDLLLRKAADLAVRPLKGEDLPTVDQVVRAKYDTGREFGRLLILDARRKYLADVTDDDARLAGYGSVQALRDAGAARWRWRPSDVVVLLKVRPLGAVA